jgi:YVTN family beta-propeller protein
MTTHSRLSASALAFALLALVACRDKNSGPTDGGPSDAGTADAGANAPFVANHSSSIAINEDGSKVFVVNADADSVSIIDVASRTKTDEVPLTASAPTVDADGGFTPAVMPRTIALAHDGNTLYVVGERSGSLYVIDVPSGVITGTVHLGSEPFGLVVSLDGKFVYAACSQDATVVKVDTNSLQVVGTVHTAAKPWALTLESDGTLVASHFLVPQLSKIDPSTMTLLNVWPVPDTQPRGDKRLAHGQSRGLYDLVPRPHSDELWVAHVMLGTDTAQPDLDFESTVFPTLSVFNPEDGTMTTRLSTNAQDVPGLNGAFADIVSGPHAIAFTSDGDYVFMVDTNSEDVMVVDARSREESSLLRPLPGHMPEGIVLSPDEQHAYVDERNTGDVVVLDVIRVDGGAPKLAIDGSPISRFSQDPMPEQLRLGQHLFYSANSDEYPITTNHWVACATCHLEGRSDAVTWRFEQGPRDTPSNAGGVLKTGFLFRTADRNQVQDYWRTIDVEQGGRFNNTDPELKPLLDAIAAYVNYAIPLPVPPTTDPDKVARGEQIFHDQSVGCVSCHAGASFTDSGTGNPTLDLSGPVVLHNVGTCVTDGPFPDVPHTDIDGNPRDGCSYDTPSLRGVSDSAPYLHDGRAATLKDVLEMTRGNMGNISGLSQDDEDALVEYLRSL